MKRRIIAALTALVMVVTMIPASAFAASTPNNAEYVDKLIHQALDINSTGKTATFENTELGVQQVKNAWNAYSVLSAEEREKLEDADVYENSYAYLEAAEIALEEYDKKMATLKDATDEFSTGTVEKDDVLAKVPGTKANKLVADYDAVGAQTVATYKVSETAVYNVTMKHSVTIEKANPKAKDLYDLVANKNNGDNALYVLAEKLEALTDADVSKEVIDAINASTYENGGTNAALQATLAKVDAVESKLTGKAADYAYLLVGYDKYMKVAEPVGEYKDLHDSIKMEYAVTGSIGARLKAVTGMAYVVGLNDIERKALDDTLSESKAVIDKYGRVLTPDFTDSAYKKFVEKYDAVQEYVSLYNNKAALLNEIDALPSEKAISTMDYTTALNLYKQVTAIVEKTTIGSESSNAVLTALSADAASKVTKVNDAVEARLAQFGGASAADYAKKIAEAVSQLPATTAEVTRADIEKVDNAIELIQEYSLVSGETVTVETLAQDEDKVFALANDAPDRTLKVSDIAEDSKLGKELDKYPNTWKKLVAATEQIVKLAVEDKASAEEVKEIIIGNDTEEENVIDGVKYGKGQLGQYDPYEDNIKKQETALNAEKIIEFYDAKYAALNTYAKADFDAAVKENVTGYKDIATEIKEATAVIDKYVVGPEVIAAAVAIKPVVQAVADVDDGELYPNSPYLAGINANIAEVEKAFENAKVKRYFVATYEELYNDYVAVKTTVESYVSDSTAVKAVIASIDALKEIKDGDKVDYAMMEKAVADYEAAVAAYNNLTAAEKSRVTNYSRLAVIKGGIEIGFKAVFLAEVEKIGNYTAGLTDTQIEQIVLIQTMVKKYDTVQDVQKDYFNYKSVTTLVDVNGSKTAAWKVYDDAVVAMNNQIVDDAQKEYLTVKADILKAVSSAVTVDKTTAMDIIKAVDAVNGLSDAAKKYFETKDASLYSRYTSNVATQYDKAKSFLLDYATVEAIADQDYTGSAITPVIVVKDFYGRTVDAKNYTVSYGNNVLPGKASITITSTADSIYGGSKTVDFNIVAKEPVKVTGVKADTDYGIVRVYFDRNADIEGLDVRYQVQYKKTTSDTWTTKYPTKGLDYLTLKNLTKNGKYDVRVRAYYDIEDTRVYGEYSDVMTVYANRNGAKSGIMYKAVINSLTTKNGSVTVKVKDVNYTSEPTDVTWKYSYKKYGTQYKTWSTWKSTKNTSYTFKNLKKGTRYVFRVQYTYTSAVDGKTAVNSNYSVYKNIVVK